MANVIELNVEAQMLKAASPLAGSTNRRKGVAMGQAVTVVGQVVRLGDRQLVITVPGRPGDRLVVWADAVELR